MWNLASLSGHLARGTRSAFVSRGFIDLCWGVLLHFSDNNEIQTSQDNNECTYERAWLQGDGVVLVEVWDVAPPPLVSACWF